MEFRILSSLWYFNLPIEIVTLDVQFKLPMSLHLLRYLL
jgi:hypothetical protein